MFIKCIRSIGISRLTAKSSKATVASKSGHSHLKTGHHRLSSGRLSRLGLFSRMAEFIFFYDRYYSFILLAHLKTRIDNGNALQKFLEIAETQRQAGRVSVLHR